jgi:hypothetical protein
MNNYLHNIMIKLSLKKSNENKVTLKLEKEKRKTNNRISEVRERTD